jgi:4'-phosphopantetheinyl transferase
LEILSPFVVAVPRSIEKLDPRARVRFLSSHSRRALRLSALKSNVRIEAPAKDENNAPLPVNGVYWSVSHKPTFVAAVVAPFPVGIDLEPIRPCSEALFRKAASPAEWKLANDGEPGFVTFFRYWTSKEAVLKASGTGLKDLSLCRIHKIVNPRLLSVAYRGRSWLIEHLYFENHVASIVKNDFEVHWSVRHGPPLEGSEL